MKFQLGGGGFPGPHSFGYAYAPIEENKKGVLKFSARFLAFSNKISTVQKIVLSSSRGQGNFRGLEASRPRPRTSKCVLEAKDVLPLVANTSSFAAGKSCQSWIMISASIRKEGRRKKVLAKCKSSKFAATPVPNKTGKSYFHSGNLMQHLKRKHPRTAWNVNQIKRSVFICNVFRCHLRCLRYCNATSQERPCRLYHRRFRFQESSCGSSNT